MKEKYLIGEVCKLFDITRDTLVHYDKIGLLSPKKDKDNGYRYYDIEDLNCLTDILLFKKLNLPLSDINKAINNSSPKDILNLIEERQVYLEEEIKKINKLQKILSSMKLNVNACVNKLDKIEFREENDNDIFVEITKENKFNDFIDIIEGMNGIVEGIDSLDKSSLEYINFSFLIDDGVLFDEHSDEKIKWGVTLRKGYKFVEEIVDYKKVEYISKSRYVYTVIGLDDDDYDDWIKYIKTIVIDNNLSIDGPILGRMLLTEYNNKDAIDYYEVYIPIK
ncbi:MAG: MerR family transcriptional regulator [Peptostreptococcaceae bacterium]